MALCLMFYKSIGYLFGKEHVINDGWAVKTRTCRVRLVITQKVPSKTNLIALVVLQ